MIRQENSISHSEKLEQLVQFPLDARLWIYTANRPLTEKEVHVIERNQSLFLKEWNAHGSVLQGFGCVLYDNFLLFGVDQSTVQASGCSIDKKVNFVQLLSAANDIDFFDRFRFVYRDLHNGIHNLSRQKFSTQFANKEINTETIMFNPLVKSIAEFQEQFTTPLKNSWHYKFV